MGLTDRLLNWIDPLGRAVVMPPALPVDYWQPSLSILGGATYPGSPYLGQGFTQTLTGRYEPIGTDYVSLAQSALAGNAVVFAAVQARVSLFAEARFQYRQIRSGRPGELFGNDSLSLLERPWPGGTTGDLLARMMLHYDLGGEAFVVRLNADRLFCPRPDWTVAVYGSQKDPTGSMMWDPDAELLGIVYRPGGSASGEEPVAYLAEQVAHFAPIVKDPLAPGRGLSWIMAVAREIASDTAMTEHKAAYLRNGATPNLIVTNVPGASPEAFQKWVDTFSAKHDGTRNAYRTMYLSGTTEAKVVGNDLAQVDFKAVQGAGETRISIASGVPAVVLGISEGLQGSSLNAGNFASSMRRFADLTMRPLWRNVAGSLSVLLNVPAGSELWYDDRDVAALKDDVKDAAEVQTLNAQAIRQLVDSGFEPASVVDAVNAGDLKRLKHTGLYSVQLQPPMPEGQPEPEPEPPAAEPDQSDAEEQPARDLAFEALSVMRTMAEREQPAPVINNYVTMPDPPAEPEPEARDMVTDLEYDELGRIVRISEVPA